MGMKTIYHGPIHQEVMGWSSKWWPNRFHIVPRHCQGLTLPETNIAPENGWPKRPIFQGDFVVTPALRHPTWRFHHPTWRTSRIPTHRVVDRQEAVDQLETTQGGNSTTTWWKHRARCRISYVMSSFPNRWPRKSMAENPWITGRQCGPI